MKVYFEGAKYNISSIDRRILNFFTETTVKDNLQPCFVGYYSDHLEKPVVILPKIAISLIDNSQSKLVELATYGISSINKDSINYDFISKFIYLFYLSLVKYCKRKPNNIISETGRIFEVNLKKSSNNSTELETVIALLDFQKSHKDLINFVAKKEFSLSSSSTDWNQTVRQRTPLISGGNVIYCDYISNQDEQNSLDQLLVVFHSLLSFFKNTYGIKVKENVVYSTLQYKNILAFNRKCKKILKKIKGEHFDDRYVKLHKLLTSYFEIQSLNTKFKVIEDKVIVRDYNIVFEDMVDLLLSDNDVINELKNQKDGKIVDHLYKYNSLFDEEEIYYIGDSKYYKDTTKHSKLSKYKQFTYAKNVIQFNVDPFGEKEQLTYRNNLTEGYNLTPSFFINGFIRDENILSPKHEFERHQDDSVSSFSCQFENRVFDRDSLHLCYFKMNFLYILKSYVTENKRSLIKLRNEVYQTIRQHFIELYNNNYDFYKLSSKSPIEEFVDMNFRSLHGKIYQCNRDNDNKVITLGLDSAEKYNDENQELLKKISTQCIITKFEIY